MSNVTVSMKMSPKATGALYMKNIRNEKRIEELEEELKKAHVTTRSVDTSCDITNKCCNQFGERDEMQTIINSLQADVIARGARIEQLEREVINLESEVNDLCGYDKYNA